MVGGSGDDESWRVLVLAGLDAGKGTSIKSFTLPDPRTGRPQGFLLLPDGRLLEMNRFKQAYSSWLSGDRLLADGGLFLGTPYDPLFLLLPLLERARDQNESCPAGKFKELDELLYDSSAPGLSELLSYARAAAATGTDNGAGALTGPQRGEGGGAGAGDTSAASGPAGAAAAAAATAAAEGGTEREGAGAGNGEAGTRGEQAGCGPSSCSSLPPPPPSLEQQLALICDVRRVDEQCYYRLNDQRVLAWLLCKFRQLQGALGGLAGGMDAAHAAHYVLSYLAEYVGDAWIGKVAQRLGINEKLAVSASGTAAAALQPTDGNAQAGPGAGSRPPPSALAGPPEKKQKVDPRVAAKQANLAKQAVGTKKLTSFFSKK